MGVQKYCKECFLEYQRTNKEKFANSNKRYLQNKKVVAWSSTGIIFLLIPVKWTGSLMQSPQSQGTPSIARCCMRISLPATCLAAPTTHAKEVIKTITNEQLDKLIRWQMAKADLMCTISKRMATAPPKQHELLKQFYETIGGSIKYYQRTVDKKEGNLTDTNIK